MHHSTPQNILPQERMQYLSKISKNILTKYKKNLVENTMIIIITDMLKNCYFTPRQELINWINQLLQTNLTKIQQLGAGNIYCQLLDAAYPSKVPLHKVKWKAVFEIDFIYNFKILQNCFDHLGIEKYIDVQKLVKAKYQDNLQFSQWMMGELKERIKLNKKYNALERRKFCSINLDFDNPLGHTKSSSQLNYFSNKENTSEVNLFTPRNSMRMKRSSLSSLQSTLIPRDKNPLAEGSTQRKRKTFLHIQSKSTKNQKNQLKHFKIERVKTEMGPLIIHDLTQELILQADQQQCF